MCFKPWEQREHGGARGGKMEATAGPEEAGTARAVGPSDPQRARRRGVQAGPCGPLKMWRVETKQPRCWVPRAG